MKNIWKGIKNEYLNSEWSFAKYRLPCNGKWYVEYGGIKKHMKLIEKKLIKK